MVLISVCHGVEKQIMTLSILGGGVRLKLVNLHLDVGAWHDNDKTTVLK